MELRVENFTPTGNNLKWLQPFKNFEMEKCLSKSKDRVKNKVYYNRMLNVLTDNRSIDVLNKESMSGTSKITQKEFVMIYINSVKEKLSVREMVQALMVVYPEQESPAGAKFLFGMVMRELKRIGDRNLATVVERITVNIDGIPVEIEATAQGVRPIFTANADITELGDDEIFPTPTRTEDGIVRFTDPAQIPVPTVMPEPAEPVFFNRQGMPNTNTLSQTESFYPESKMSKFDISISGGSYVTTGDKNKKSRVSQTVLSGENGYPISRNDIKPLPIEPSVKSSYTETVKTGDFGGMSVLPKNIAEMNPRAQQGYLDAQKARLNLHANLPSNLVHMLNRLEKGEPSANL